MPPTLARRYLFKLLANLVSVPVYLVMEAILPRALGPQAYGNYNFATSIFQQFSGFLDMGTSTCFYNALSRRQNETALFTFYMRIACFVGLVSMLAGFLLLWEPAGEWLLPGVPHWLAPLAALWAFLAWWGRVLRSANDALGATVPSESLRSIISLGGLFILAVLFYSNSLNIQTLFLQQYLLSGALILAFWHVSKRQWQQNKAQIPSFVSKNERKKYFSEFFHYSHPLFVQALLSFFMLTAERWLLQWFDGSAQQGFYALSQKVSMACFLFVSAMTPLLMREFSIAWGKHDLTGMGHLLTRFAPLLYMLSAYFSCFTVVEAQTLVKIFGGEEFVAAVLPVQIMALYPLHQAYGQMAGSVFHASGKTHIPRNLAAAECIYGLAAAWLLLAPANLGGFNLGATGLAIKTVSVQFLTVNIYLWLAARFIPFHFWRNLCHQIFCVCLLLLLAWLCALLSRLLPISADAFLLRFTLAGIFYTIAVIGICGLFPKLAGLSRQEIKELLIRFGRHNK